MDGIALRASDHALEVIFSYLDLHTLRNCSLVCKRWQQFLNDENNEVWRTHCIRKLAQEALSSDLLSSVPTYKSKLRSFYHAWNPNDCSRNIYIKPNGFTLHRLVQRSLSCRFLTNDPRDSTFCFALFARIFSLKNNRCRSGELMPSLP